MDVVLQKDIEKIFEDMQDIKEGLEALRKSHVAWAISREHDDLMCIYQGLKSLESNDLKRIQAMGKRASLMPIP
jgi:hypothetical protein